MIEAVEAVRNRARRSAAALELAGIRYAIAGGNAVAAWVARVDRAAVRNTQDVDILVRRSDFEAIKLALAAEGFQYRNVSGLDCFIDGPQGSARDTVNLIFAGQKIRPNHPGPSADVSESVPADEFIIVTLEALVQMKLNSFRDKDRTHLRDLIEVGLVDATWLGRLQPELAERLQQWLDDPEG